MYSTRLRLVPGNCVTGPELDLHHEPEIEVNSPLSLVLMASAQLKFSPGAAGKERAHIRPVWPSAGLMAAGRFLLAMSTIQGKMDDDDPPFLLADNNCIRDILK